MPSYKFSPETAESFCKFMEEKVPFNLYLGLKVARLEEGFARVELPFRSEFIGDPVRPALHGGVISSLADTCGVAAIFTSAGSTDGISTVDIRIDYLRPGRSEPLVAEGRVVRQGDRVGVVDIHVFHPEEPEIYLATCKGVYNIRRSEDVAGS